MRALIVDDSRTMRMMLGRMLLQRGFSIEEAGNGVEALARLQGQAPPALVLIDWNMPEMNGLDLLRAIRGDTTFDAMKVMMVTTEAELERVETALAAGADEYVMKPFTPDGLKEKLALLGFEAAPC